MKLLKVICVLGFGLASFLTTTCGWSQTWISTSTKGVGPFLVNATTLGPLPDSTPLHIAVGLALPDRSGLNQYIQAINNPASPLYGSSLTPGQFVATYGPSGTQVQAVSNYLSANGFSNIQIEPNHLLVTADGTAAQSSNAFHTSLGQFQQNGQIIYANLTDAQVPASLSGAVTAVLGLNNISGLIPPLHTQAISVPPIPSVHLHTPQDFWTAYDVGSTPAGSGTSIAIFAEGDVTQVVSDLRFAEAVNQLPQVPVQVIAVGGCQLTDTSNVDEWDLDTQLSSGMAQNVQTLLIYVACSLNDADMMRAFNTFATANAAKAGSASFGECEVLASLDGAMAMDDEIFAEAAAQGQSIFTAAGDNGSACPVAISQNGVPLGGAAGMVEYPASSPYVIAVGGTTLITDANSTYTQETGWSASGGGTSGFEPSPSWQSAVSPTSPAGKGVPDISMDADPTTGAIVYTGCTQNEAPAACQTGLGGASLSSPLALGVWARLESGHANQLGFAAPKLYRNAQPLPNVTSGSGFYDILAGCNGLFCAIPGYDYVTGLGTFDVSVMSATIK